MIQPALTHAIETRSSGRSGWGIRLRQLGLIGLALAGVCASDRIPVDDAALPFSVGEKITYEVRLGNGNKVGTATMWVEGPVDVRGTSTYLLRFDSRVRIALLSAESQSSSWFDPVRGSALRFIKHEQNPLTRNDESVDFYPDQKEWKTANGETGPSPTNTPLDELSFMYFIRTLPMTPGATYRVDRHFDLARNPTSVNVIRREMIPTPMGELRTVLVEMHVHDPRHYRGDGVIRINLTDDECRLPTRIESTMPVVGKAILTIDSQNSRCRSR
jgi:hypothetical protein